MILFLFILLTIATYYLTKDLFHPALMMILFWTTGYIMIALLPSFYIPSLESQIIIISYIFLFIFFSLLTGFVMKNIKKQNNNLYLQNANSIIILSLVWVVLTVLMIFIFKYIDLLMSYDSLRAYFFYVRDAKLHGVPLVEINPIFYNIRTYASVLSVIVLYELLKKDSLIKKKYFMYVFIFVVLISSLIEGTRSGFIILVFSYISLYILIKGNKVIYKTLLVFLISFFFISMFTRGGNMLNNDFLIAIEAFFTHITTYAFGSLISFEAFLESNFGVYSSIVIKVIDKINSVLDLFGFNTKLVHPELTQLPFIPISNEMSTNVFSFLAVRITYFGFYGAAIVTIIHAILITIVYKLSKVNIIFFFVYLIMIPTTILSLFHEYFFALIPYYFRMVMLVLLIYYVDFNKLLCFLLNLKKEKRIET